MLSEEMEMNKFKLLDFSEYESLKEVLEALWANYCTSLVGRHLDAWIRILGCRT